MRLPITVGLSLIGIAPVFLAAGAVFLFVFGMSPARAALAAGIFLGYKIGFAIVFLVMMTSAA